MAFQFLSSPTYRLAHAVSTEIHGLDHSRSLLGGHQHAGLFQGASGAAVKAESRSGAAKRDEDGGGGNNLHGENGLLQNK